MFFRTEFNKSKPLILDQIIALLDDTVKNEFRMREEYCLPQSAFFHLEVVSPSLKAPRSIFCDNTHLHISIRQFIEEIHQTFVISEKTWIIMLGLLDIYFTKNRYDSLHTYNVHRFILIALLVASKKPDARCLSNEMIADFGNISLLEVNRLERVFKEIIGAKVKISEKKYQEIVEILNAIPAELLEQKEIEHQESGLTCVIL